MPASRAAALAASLAAALNQMVREEPENRKSRVRLTYWAKSWAQQATSWDADTGRQFDKREAMSIFSKIKDAIFGHKSVPTQAQPGPVPQPVGATTAQDQTQVQPQTQ